MYPLNEADLRQASQGVGFREAGGSGEGPQWHPVPSSDPEDRHALTELTGPAGPLAGEAATHAEQAGRSRPVDRGGEARGPTCWRVLLRY